MVHPSEIGASKNVWLPFIELLFHRFSRLIQAYKASIGEDFLYSTNVIIGSITQLNDPYLLVAEQPATE
jgi:hypothetical protein